MKNQIINTSKAPKPIGAYNQAVIRNGFVFTSGQVPIDPNTGKLVDGSFKERVRRVMNNLKFILEKAETDFSNVTRFSVFLTDISNYSEVNEVFNEFIKDGDAPSRSLIEVSSLPAGADIEIDCIAAF
ncbi:MAG: Rid family detoxifying hydrolase [Candidatus Marinimicrobia bacterium]|jgi:2-iminobutanoate/2-iminopropanoate deaminase|nr:Rid family detoxifying hydrolase [Candidatus Neomarinimicrobiota bacterium]